MLVHHYLDTMVHCCPAKLWKGAGGAVEKVSRQRQRRSKRRKRPHRESEDGSKELKQEQTQGQVSECVVCGQHFGSRNQLFKHIKASGSTCMQRDNTMKSSSPIDNGPASED